MKQEILVKVEHMNKRFGSTVALKDVSIEVCSGRVPRTYWREWFW